MRYIKKPDKLGRIVDTLALKEIHATDFYRLHLKHQLASALNKKDKLILLFALANSGRQGKGKDNENLVAATAGFSQGFEQKINIIKPFDAAQAHKKFLEWLCDIPHMEQKTANLFIKWVVTFESEFNLDLSDCRSWKPLLHIPLDRWVIRLMGKKYLDFCTDDFEKDFLNVDGNPKSLNLALKKKEYIELQHELGQVSSAHNKPRIVLDTLWFVGYIFCKYRPFLCNSCWVSKECSNSSPIPDLGNMPLIKTKSEQKEKKRVTAEWIRNNPKAVEEFKKKHGLVDSNVKR